jgi:hypothetical protein
MESREFKRVMETEEIELDFTEDVFAEGLFVEIKFVDRRFCRRFYLSDHLIQMIPYLR